MGRSWTESVSWSMSSCGQRIAVDSAGPMGDHGGMRLRDNIGIDEAVLRRFAQRHAIRRLAAFGSVLRDDFGEDSDIDLLVEFDEHRIPGFLDVAAMELELAEEIGRDVDLRTYHDLSRHFRDSVRRTSVEIYAA